MAQCLSLSVAPLSRPNCADLTAAAAFSSCTIPTSMGRDDCVQLGRAKVKWKEGGGAKALFPYSDREPRTYESIEDAERITVKITFNHICMSHPCKPLKNSHCYPCFVLLARRMQRRRRTRATGEKLHTQPQIFSQCPPGKRSLQLIHTPSDDGQPRSRRPRSPRRPAATNNHRSGEGWRRAGRADHARIT